MKEVTMSGKVKMERKKFEKEVNEKRAHHTQIFGYNFVCIEIKGVEGYFEIDDYDIYVENQKLVVYLYRNAIFYGKIQLSEISEVY
jgi:hypothetical protein